MPVEKICLICKKSFKVIPFRKNRAKYCSMKCYASISPKVKRTCLVCEKIFYAKPSIIKKGHARYCSRYCASIIRIGKPNLAWLGKHHTEKAKKKISKNNARLSGKNNHRWQGGQHKNTNGYIMVYKPTHPFAKQNYVRRSRIVAEKALGRYLEPNEIVHHINKTRDDDRIENLFIFETRTEHSVFHSLSKTNPFLKTFLKSNLV